MIRPVEMQMLLPRTESVGTEQQHENQRVVNENAFAANEVAREVKHNSETVIRKEFHKLAQHQYDAKEEGKGTYKDPRRQKHSQKDSEEEEEDVRDSMKSDSQPRINIQI